MMRSVHVLVGCAVAVLIAGACGQSMSRSTPPTSTGVARTTTTVAPSDPMAVTTTWILPYFPKGAARATDLATTLPAALTTETLGPPDRRPNLTADEAIARADTEGGLRRYLIDGASVEMYVGSLADSTATGAAQARPTIVYDFEIRASVCIPSGATTAPPGVTAARLTCTVRILINADTGSPLGTTELFG
jgi:hypothetical protein